MGSFKPVDPVCERDGCEVVATTKFMPDLRIGSPERFACPDHPVTDEGWMQVMYENREMYAARMVDYTAECRRAEQAAIARGERWHGEGQGYFKCDGTCEYHYVDPYTHIGEMDFD